eukprot:113678-Amorphochlora_amoeboformis.AAC.1
MDIAILRFNLSAVVRVLTCSWGIYAELLSILRLLRLLTYGRRVPSCAIRLNPVSAESCTTSHFRYHGSKLSPIPAAFCDQSVRI